MKVIIHVCPELSPPFEILKCLLGAIYIALFKQIIGLVQHFAPGY
jgi:hypothetical protein